MAQLNKRLFKSEDVFKDMDLTVDADTTFEPLKVQFGDLEVVTGSVLSPTQVKAQPHIEWEDANPEHYYCLIMNDPDAPSRESPKFREWHHWCVANIPGSNIKNGEVLAEYVGAGPPKDTGLHRYVFLVYKQLRKLDFGEKRLKNTSGEGRGNHSAHKFTSKHKMEGPIAGNFFQAEWDEYVPELMKQLFGK